MPVEILVPQIGEAVTELTLVTWLKAVGDDVRKGDVLFEIDSDKAIVEVEAFVDGTLVEILHPADSTVMPQQVVALLQTVDEAETESSIDNAPAANEPISEVKVSPVAQRIADEQRINLAHVLGTGPGGRITADDVRNHADHLDGVSAASNRQIVNASPKARLLAKEHHIDLTRLTGSGVAGMIRVKDVEAIVSNGVQHETVPLSKLQQTIAARTLASKHSVPHFYLMVDVDMTQVNALRDYCRNQADWERPPTYTDVMIRACALAVESMPQVNRSFSENGLIVRKQIGIAVAVHTDNGLVAPVIADANTLDLQATSEALRSLAARAREGRLKPGDIGEKSLVISNLGMHAVDTFIAIIDMPDPMILAVGRVADRLVPVDGQAVILPMCTLSLSVDHRVLDGVEGARFLERVKDFLEHPFELKG